MRHTLEALLTQLNWRKNKIHSQLHIVEQKCTYLLHLIEELEDQLSTPYPRTNIINPEFEMNRLNFNLQLQQEKISITQQLKEQYTQKEVLQNKVQRIKTELKMLERHLIKEQKKVVQGQTKTAELALEEWVLQKGAHLEN